MFNKFIFVCTFILSITAHATFIEEDQIEYTYLNLENKPSNMNESEFQNLVVKIQNIFASVVSKHNGKLKVSGQWKSEVLNAYAKQMFGSWQVVITGGLARMPQLTHDGFTLILCHELGHHLGGFPFATTAIPILGNKWMSNEGQSDYYSTLYCARKLWKNDFAKNAEFRMTASQDIKNACDLAWKNPGQQEWCYRALTASESVTATLAAIKGTSAPKITTPNATIVNATYDGHPEVQCRLDTYAQGALCNVAFDENVIPGKNVSSGPQSLAAEQYTASYSCTNKYKFTTGLRPNCWYKERL